MVLVLPVNLHCSKRDKSHGKYGMRMCGAWGVWGWGRFNIQSLKKCFLKKKVLKKEITLLVSRERKGDSP